MSIPNPPELEEDEDVAEPVPDEPTDVPRGDVP